MKKTQRTLLVVLLAVLLGVVAFTLVRQKNPGPPAVVAAPAVGDESPPSESDAHARPVAGKHDAAIPPTRAFAAGAVPPAPQPHRLPDPPLGPIYDDLLGRMNKGDAEAASQLARGLSYCSQARDLGANMASIEKALDPSRIDLTMQDRQNLQNNLDAMQDQLAKFGKDPSFCAGLTPQQIDTFTSTALIAGELGDKDAADCFVGLGSQQAMGVHMDHGTYQKSAVELAADMIQQGDWTMVRLLSSAYGNYPNRQYLSQLLPKNPVQAYRLLKLERLGTAGFNPAAPDPQLAQAAAALGKEDLAAADAWAQNTYQSHFKGSAPLPAGEQPNVCVW